MEEYTHIAYIPQEDFHEILVSGAYSFNGERRCHWLQRLCLWVLRKLECQHYKTVPVHSRIQIKNRSIYELIKKQSYALWTGSATPKTVILGREQMEALEVECLNKEFAYQITQRFPYKEFWGMKIIMSPYFDGVICLYHDC